MLSFLAPMFLAGAAAAAVPIVLHLLKREPEERVKFAAGEADQAGAGGAHRPAAPARAAAAGAARDGARAAGAGVRAPVPRDRRGGRLDRRHRRRARHVVQPRGARALRAREAAGEGGDREGAGRRSRRRRHVRRRGRDRRAAGIGPDAGHRRDRAGVGRLRRHPLPRRRCRRRRSTSPAATAPSSSSPTCRRTAGTPAIARRCRTGRRFRSRMSGRCRRTSRSPPCGRWRTASSPPCTTAGRARAMRACT